MIDITSLRFDSISLRFAPSSPRSLSRASSRLRRREQPSVADLAHIELEWVVGRRAGEPGKLAGRRDLVDRDGRLVVGRVEEMLGCVAFHGACIGRTVAPLEG